MHKSLSWMGTCAFRQKDGIMKKFWGLLLVLCMGITMEMQGQNFEEEFNAFLKQNEQNFNQFVDSINRQFAEAMEANMRAFTGEQPKIRDSKPKPIKVPVVTKDEEPVNLPIPKPESPTTKPKSTDKPQGPSSEKKPDEITPSNLPSEYTNILNFNIFGESIRFATKAFPKELANISAKAVSQFWIQLSESDYQGMINQCQSTRKEMAFNDWAIYQLVTQMAQETYPRQYDEQVVMTIFLLNQLGMEAKIGFGNMHLFCLVAVEQQLYGMSFCDIGDHRYYVFELNPRYLNMEASFSFQTYDNPFPKKTSGIDMNLRHALKSKNVETTIEDDSLINISMSMIDLFRTYPQVDLEVYANACPSTEFCQSLDRLMRPYLKDYSQVEAVSLLLYYVQHGFDYATDDEQFGYEKPFFCEENFYYPQNDCEDRSVLFSFLVRYLLNMEVVLIDYPGHVATAVHFNQELSGESIMHKGKKYIICDPTYIGATIGMEMPEFSPTDRTVIPLRN